MKRFHEPCPDHCDHPSKMGIDRTWGPDKIWRCMSCGALPTTKGSRMPDPHFEPSYDHHPECYAWMRDWRERAHQAEDHLLEVRACIEAEAVLAGERHRQTALALSGFSWFEWGLRRALAFIDQGAEAEEWDVCNNPPGTATVGGSRES